MYNLVTPTPNLNGNSKESLIAQCRDIMDALKDLDDIIGKSNDLWHGRNFVPQGSEKATEAQRRAQAAWMDRRTWLHEFNKDVLDMALKIQRQP